MLDAIVVCLIYLRHNTVQAALGEQSRISQATVSRYVEMLEPVVSVCLDGLAMELREQATRSDLVVDGFLVPPATSPLRSACSPGSGCVLA